MSPQDRTGATDFRFLNFDDKGAWSTSLSESLNLATSFLFLENLSCIDCVEACATFPACDSTVFVGLLVEAPSPGACVVASKFAGFFDFITDSF